MKTVEFAVKWWSEYLNGSKTDGLIYLNDQQWAYAQENYPEIAKSIYFMNIKIRADAERRKVSASEKKRFEEELTKLLDKDLNERGRAYLFTEDKDEDVRGTLGLASYYAGVYHSKDSLFPANVEMFISKEKVEVRNNGQDLRTIFSAEPNMISSGSARTRTDVGLLK